MKKINFLTKIAFQICNIALILIYLYPGSILGWLIYANFQKQPQFTSSFQVSETHICAFAILSFLGLISFTNEKIKILFFYLFSISLILELSHLLIPKRSFEYEDLFGNFIGVFLVFIFFNIYKIIKNK